MINWFPFYYHVEMKDGSIKEFLWDDSSLKKVWESYKYQPKSCQVCSDFAAEQADIACCDAWLEERRGNQKGYSIVLTHTPLWSSYIENLIQDGTLLLKRCDESYIERSQYAQIARKLENKQRTHG